MGYQWRVATSNPALRCCFASQSCLCPTPEFRSFHMGIALSTFSTLPAPLRSISRWLQRSLLIETEKSAGIAPAPSSSNLLHAHIDPRHRGVPAVSGEEDKAGKAGVLASPPPTGNRPLRGNWPFNVKPPVTAPHAPVGSSASKSSRSFLPTSSVGSRSAFFTSLASERRATQPARVLRRASDAGAGRMVIAGRMADVCAELDRMAALENLQTR